MDHFSKALERAQRDGHSVRKWVQPAPSSQADLTSEQFEGLLTPRVVALNTKVMQREHILGGQDVEDPIIADRYRLLRTQLLQRMRANGWKRLAITSPGPKAGKTVTATNLAISMARDGNQQVVLIDADLRKPSVATVLGIEPEAGLIDFLAGGATVDSIAFSIEEIPNLVVLPGRRVGLEDATPELLSNTRMRALLDRLSMMSPPPIVVVDTPPVFVGDDVILIAEHLDAVILIVEEGATEIDELKTAAELLQEFNLIGTVLNKSSEKHKPLAGYYHTESTRSLDSARK